MQSPRATIITNSPLNCLVQPAGIEPASIALQATAMTTSAKVALYLVHLTGVEPVYRRVITLVSNIPSSALYLVEAGGIEPL